MFNIWTGLMLRIFDIHVPSPAIFFTIGGSLKIIYLTLTFKKLGLKPGIEFLFLAGGLLALFLGIYTRKVSPESVLGTTLIVKAVVLKITFLILVIRKLRAARLKANAISVRHSE